MSNKYFNLWTILIVWIIAVSIPAGVYVAQQSQDIRQRAQVYSTCDAFFGDCRADATGCIGHGQLDCASGETCVTNCVPTGSCPAGACGSCGGTAGTGNSISYVPSTVSTNTNSDVLQASSGCNKTCKYNGCVNCVSQCQPECGVNDHLCWAQCPGCKNGIWCQPNAGLPSPTPGGSGGPIPTPPTQPTCNSVCTNSANCLPEHICYFQQGQNYGNCRNPSCANETSCTCSQVPDCLSLTTTADLNNLQVGTQYSFQITAVGASTIDHVEMSVHGATCADSLKPYAPVAVSGPGTYTINWTPTTAGTFIAYGRVWNDAIAECRADCVGGTNVYLCSNAASCKLTGTVNAVISAQCTNVKLYTVNGDPNVASNWALIPADQLTHLQPGTTVYATVLGTVTNGVIDKARIRMNSTAWTTNDETTVKKPGSEEFYKVFILPTGTTSFTFGAEVHEQNQDKWY